MEYSVGYMKECFDYNIETGEFRWKVRPRNHFNTDRGWNSVNASKAGKLVGTTISSGRVKVHMNLQLFQLDRIAVYLVDGSWPSFGVSHINGNVGDNRYCNLRLENKDDFGSDMFENKDDITQEYIKECIDYNEVTGEVKWKVRPRSHFSSIMNWEMFNHKMRFNEINSTHCRGHSVVKINGFNYKIRRLIYLYLYGSFPELGVTHANGDKKDNKINNLILRKGRLGANQ